MKTLAVQISLDEDLLRRIDADPEAKEKGRSAFVRAAVQVYLQARRRRQVDESIIRAFRGKKAQMLREIEDLIEAQTWPER